MRAISCLSLTVAVSLYQLNLSDLNLRLLLDNVCVVCAWMWVHVRVCVLNWKETLSHLTLLYAQSLLLKLVLSPFLTLVHLFIYLKTWESFHPFSCRAGLVFAMDVMTQLSSHTPPTSVHVSLFNPHCLFIRYFCSPYHCQWLSKGFLNTYFSIFIMTLR